MKTLRVLHLEDNAADAFMIREALQQSGLEAEVDLATNAQEFRSAIEHRHPDVILADSGLPSFNGNEALRIARTLCPEVPFIFVSGSSDEAQTASRLEAGAVGTILKGDWDQLAGAVKHATSLSEMTPIERIQRHNRGMMRLVKAVQDLSLARTLHDVMTVVRTAARELTGADGATFVLRDNGKCYYADEDAIEPLWKGQRFPMSACISGWAMLNKQSVVIEDIFADARIPHDAYRPTFVKSLVMVPIRTEAPIGAIGNYWAQPHLATPEEVQLLEALANTTAVAMESVELYAELERRVQDRTVQLEAANRELETFSYSVSHDLQAPLRLVTGFTQLLTKRAAAKLDEKELQFADAIVSETKRMGELIQDLLRLAKVARTEMKREPVDLSGIARVTVQRLRSVSPDREVEVKIQDGIEVVGDRGLLGAVLENLLSNAWKYSSKRENARVEFGTETQADGSVAFFIRDNGAGFDMKHAERLFAPFQRLHTVQEFAGTGVGLATVQRIIHRHGGRIWAQAEVDRGATFYFTLPTESAPAASA